MWQTASKLQRQTWGIDHDEFKESRFWRPHCYSLSERTPLERCCIHNMSPFVSSIVAFLQAVARPKFRGPRSASIARSQVWLGLPAGRFKSGGTCRIHAASTRWWSSRGELQAIWPKSRRHLLVTRWESGEQPVVLLTSAFDTWQLRTLWACRGQKRIDFVTWIIIILIFDPFCQISQHERKSFKTNPYVFDVMPNNFRCTDWRQDCCILYPVYIQEKLRNSPAERWTETFTWFKTWARGLLPPTQYEG